MSLLPTDPVTEVKDIIGLIIIVVIIGALGWLTWDNQHLRAIVEKQKTEIADYKTANEAFAQQVADQNTAIEVMKTAATNRATAAATAIASAQKDAKVLYDKASKILATKQVGDECTAVKQFLSSYFGGTP